MKRLSAHSFSTACALLGLGLLACTATVTGSPPGGPTGGSGSGSGSSGAGGTGSGPPGTAGAAPGAGGNGSGGTTGPGPGAGGQAGTGVVGTGGGAVVACGDGLTNRRLRRLSRREYANVVSDLLGPTSQAAVMGAWPFEPLLSGFDHQDSALYVSDSLHETISDLAAALATAVNPTVLAPCATAAGSAACLQTFVSTFTTKAYGRVLATDELARVNAVAALGESYATSVRLVVELTLQSPHFLYISELGPPAAAATPGAPVALTPAEVASQLSFMLTGGRPDTVLLKAVDTATLSKTADVMREADRLIKTPRAAVELTRFVNGWFDMAPIADAPKSSTDFAALTPAVVTAMQQEYDTFVTTQLKQGQGTVAAFLSERSAGVPAALAPIYGTDLANGVLNPAHRRGIISLPGFLTYHASYQHSGPVERGLLVRRQLFCQTVPAPPESALMRIATNPVNPDDKSQTTRQKYSAHVNEPSCAACHQRFDPIGFGLEEMDGIGRYRTTENNLPVDTSGELTGTDVDGKFAGVAELAGKLAQSKMLEACVVSHFFRFSQSRPADANDACVVQNFVTRLSTAGGRIGELVAAQVSHSTFVNRKDDR